MLADIRTFTLEVYTSLTDVSTYANKIQTTQISLPQDACEEFYAATIDYAASVPDLARVATANDSVFGDNSMSEMAAMMMAVSGNVSSGYTGILIYLLLV